MTRLARTLLVYALPTLATAAAVLPPLIVRIDYAAISPGDSVTTLRHGFGEVDSVEEGFITVTTPRGTYRIPAEQVTER